MKIPNEKENFNILQLIILLILTLKTLRSLLKCIAKPYSFLFNNITDNHLGFRRNLLEKIKKVIMTMVKEIRDEKIQYDVNRKVAKISALSSGKISTYRQKNYVWLKSNDTKS